MDTPQVVTYIYTLRNSAGKVLEKSGEKKVAYIESMGQVLPSVERALQGCTAGTRKRINIPAKDGYGLYKEDFVIEVPKSRFKRMPQMDQEIMAKAPSGNVTAMRVVDMKDEAVVLDGNHPFAGEDLVFDIEVLETRPANSRELKTGHLFL